MKRKKKKTIPAEEVFEVSFHAIQKLRDGGKVSVSAMNRPVGIALMVMNERDQYASLWLSDSEAEVLTKLLIEAMMSVRKRYYTEADVDKFLKDNSGLMDDLAGRPLRKRSGRRPR